MTDLQTPLDHWLAEQGRLTAVDRFAQWHERHERGQDVTQAWTGPYRSLVPLAAPQPSEQYAFEVDLDACTGCKACVVACHSLNGLDETESWRSVGLLFAEGASGPLQQSVTTACHHCLEPACAKGCPVDAYDKDPLTGIVRHLDDQCIGCRYCVLTCPYEVPRFNERLGIVRKCDMCTDRLAAGEAPACVQSCPNEAIRITIVRQADVRALAAAGEFLADTPDPALTVPTTVYRSARPALTTAVAADGAIPRLAEGHPPLVLMLVLTQLSVGAFAADGVIRAVHGAAPGGGAGVVTALGAGLLALAASVLHLGRPLYAWRAVIGLRHSWLSREIVAFGLFAAFAAAHAALSAWPVLAGRLPAWQAPVLAAAVALIGAAGVACSVMIYVVTRRAWWRPRFTAVKFALTAAACGPATVAVIAAGGAIGTGWTAPARAAAWCAIATAAAAALKLATEAALLPLARRGAADELGRTALLLTGPLRRQTQRRFACGIAGGVALPLLLAGLVRAQAAPAACLAVALAALALLTAGEAIERAQFFRAAAPPRMPGAPS